MVNPEKSPRSPSPARMFSFTLKKRQVEDIHNEILVDADLVAGGTEQEDGSVRYEWILDEIEDALEFLAAACNHAELIALWMIVGLFCAGF